MGFLKNLFGRSFDPTLDGLKRRVTVGSKITLLSTHLHGSDMPLPDALQGVTRIVRAVRDDCIQFDLYEPAGEHRSFLYWPEERKEGFLGLLNGPHGIFKGFMDHNTFIIENSTAWSVYSIQD